MIWKVPKISNGETFAILAGGPSLKDFDPSVLKGCRVITINDSWRISPKADYLYFCDKKWWQYHQDRNLRSLDNKISFHELIYKGFWVKGGPGFNDHPQVHSLAFCGQVGLSHCPESLRHGSNSGYAAINLAYLLGASKIILLGYDLDFSGSVTHWHREPREQPTEFRRTLEHSMLPLFPFLVDPLEEAGVKVINANPNSALLCWPRMELQEALEHGKSEYSDKRGHPAELLDAR